MKLIKEINIKTWQTQISGWGSIVWLASFQFMEYANKHGYHEVSNGIFGYILGFVTAFAGYLFWEVIHGRWKSILGEDRGFMRIVSAMPLLGLCILGALGFINAIFNSMPWFYNISFAVAGIVVTQGLVPIINHIDGTAS